MIAAGTSHHRCNLPMALGEHYGKPAGEFCSSAPLLKVIGTLNVDMSYSNDLSAVNFAERQT
jgi:hypothetical protein